MKNYFKKFSIMFVMLLAIIGVGIIENGSVANAATIGQQLTQPESGWKRYDDVDSRIQYVGTWTKPTNSFCYNSTISYTFTFKGTTQFKFYGSKIRIVSNTNTTGTPSAIINIDGNDYTYSNYSNTSNTYQILLFEKNNLSVGTHNITIRNEDTNGKGISLDAIDIDSTGYLVNPYESISLDKSSINLTIGDSKQLTATTTPAGAEVEWSSDNTGIATVEPDGTIKGISVGTATITAKIKGSETKATCTVTTGTIDLPSTGTGLFIELVDGNIKQYDVSSDEITKFINWYKYRDNDKSQMPYYKFTKGTYTDYVVHDKIDWFEIR